MEPLSRRTVVIAACTYPETQETGLLKGDLDLGFSQVPQDGAAWGCPHPHVVMLAKPSLTSRVMTSSALTLQRRPNIRGKVPKGGCTHLLSHRRLTSRSIWIEWHRRGWFVCSITGPARAC
jgi:hypothetical protein